MAQVTKALDFTPIVPNTDELSPQGLLVDYDDDADMLHDHFFARPLLAMNVDVTEYLYLRVDIDTHRVVGLQIDGYLHYAVQRDPALLELVKLAGIDFVTIEAVRKTITFDRKRESAVRAILHDLKLATA